MLKGWPESLDALAERVARSLDGSADAPSLGLRDLGLLGRHLDTRLPQTRLRRLVREQLGGAALRARTPIKFRIGIEGVRDARAVLTITQAAKATGISRAVLLRLCPEGESFAGGRAGRGGALRFAAQRLMRSARVFDDALTPASAAALLGVPEYCMPALVIRRLVDAVDDGDILLMKRAPYTISRASIEALEARFARAQHDPSASPDRLDLSLAHHFSPAVWAGVLKSLSKGWRGFSHLEGSADEGPLTRRIYADRETVADLAAEVVRPRVPRGATVTAQAATLLLGISFPPFLSLIEDGHLPAERVDGAWRLKVADLANFDRDWIMAPELVHRTRGASRFLPHLSAPPEPAFATTRIRAWPRPLGEQWHGLAEDLTGSAA